MKAGVMDQRVTILTPTYASSQQSGQGVASFATLATVWAAVRALTGAEILAAGAIASEVTYEVEMRFRADVTPKVRLQWTPFRGVLKTLEVHAVQVGLRTHGGMVLVCGVVE